MRGVSDVAGTSVYSWDVASELLSLVTEETKAPEW